MITFMGSEATMYVDRGRFELIPEPRFKQQPEEMILGAGPRGRDFYERPDGELLHLQNWVDAIRNNRQPSAAGGALGEPGLSAEPGGGVEEVRRGHGQP
jgi:hypothetical protein